MSLFVCLSVWLVLCLFVCLFVSLHSEASEACDWWYWCCRLPHGYMCLCVCVCHRFKSFSWNLINLSRILRSPSLGTAKIFIPPPVHIANHLQVFHVLNWFIRDPNVSYLIIPHNASSWFMAPIPDDWAAIASGNHDETLFHSHILAS